MTSSAKTRLPCRTRRRRRVESCRRRFLRPGTSARAVTHNDVHGPRFGQRGANRNPSACRCRSVNQPAYHSVNAELRALDAVGESADGHTVVVRLVNDG